MMSANPSGAGQRQFRMHAVTKNDETRVRCSGRLTSDSSEYFKEQVKAQISQAGRIVLDLTDLTHMDSSGLGALVSIYVSCKSAKCQLEMINLSKNVRELLGLTKVLSLFEACGSYMVRMP